MGRIAPPPPAPPSAAARGSMTRQRRWRPLLLLLLLLVHASATSPGAAGAVAARSRRIEGARGGAVVGDSMCQQRALGRLRVVRGGASSTQQQQAKEQGEAVDGKHAHKRKGITGALGQRMHKPASFGKGEEGAAGGKQQQQQEEPPPSQLTFKNPPPALKWLGAGAFHRTEWDHQGRAHYERGLSVAEAKQAIESATGRPLAEDEPPSSLPRTVHLYWHPPSAQWVLHLDLDPALDYDHYLGYCKVNSPDVGQTDQGWLLRQHKKWLPSPSLRLSIPGRILPELTAETARQRALAAAGVAMPPRLIPVFTAFFFDAVATGLASPILPFYIMGLGANAFQLGLVLAFNYAAQTIGCIIMGGVSDRFGRRPVMLCCLAASFCSLSVVARAKTLPQVALGRVIGGMCGGFVPLAQSAVADLCPVEGRAKFLGRIQACMGAGFVAGPALSLLCSRVYGLDTRGILKRAAFLPALAFLFGLLFIKETKDPAPLSSLSHAPTLDLPSSTAAKGKKRGKGGLTLPPLPVRLLVLNGFLLMYAFSVETVYAMFIKDNFGYEETALGAVFALNGLAVGVLQVFFIKDLFARLGKHVMLALGNTLLAAGMVGLSVVRKRLWLHFALFSLHIVGYAISDTALASLISRYSSPDSQGKNLGWSHAAQSCARIISPLVAGTLYEMSKAPDHPLPPGALPYIAGSVMPLLGSMVPTVLYLRSIEAKKKRAAAAAT